MYYLIVDLKSAVCAGSGSGGPGYIDRDVILDPVGLPMLPARRLKGLLREAFRDVLSALKMSDKVVESLELYLFGEIGAEESGRISIRNGRLCASGTLAPDTHLPALLLRLQRENKSDSKPDPGRVQPDEVSRQFTEIRRQTSIDPKTGVARQETFRSSRALRPGLRFAAKIEFPAGMDSDLIRLTALAAAGLQRMGTSRTRGLGRVSCCLFNGTVDETAQAITDLGEGKLKYPTVPKQLKSRPLANGAPPPEASKDTMMLRYRLELSESAVFAGLEGDPNLVATQHHVPGSTIQGLLARRFLATQQVDEVFYELFCRGRLRFLPAYPQAPDSNTGSAVRLLPVPASLRTPKSDQNRFINLAADNPKRDPAKRISQAWTVPKPALFRGVLETRETGRQFTYHHARPTSDRRIGRAIGEDRREAYGLRPDESPGAVFTYESLLPGQAFQGLLIGDSASLNAARALIGSGQTAALGRSKNAQYGADAKWTWLDEKPVAPDLDGGEVSAWKEKHLWNDEVPRQSVTILLLSAMMGYDETTGHPCPVLPLAQIGSRTGLPLGSINKSFSQDGWASSFLAHQGLARQQMPVLEAGTMFTVLLASTSAGLDQDAWDKALRTVQEESFGLRTEQGFGRIALLPDANMEADGARTVLGEDQPPPVKLQDSPQARTILSQIQGERLHKLARASGMDLAQGCRNYEDRSLSFLTRLQTEIRLKKLDELGARLSKWKRYARSRLEAVRVEQAPLWPDQQAQLPLDELLAKFVRDRASIVRRIADNPVTSWSTFPISTMEQETIDQLSYLILESFVSSLLWKTRTNRKLAKTQ